MGGGLLSDIRYLSIHVNVTESCQVIKVTVMLYTGQRQWSNGYLRMYCIPNKHQDQ